MHTLTQPRLMSAASTSAAERALRRWFPLCNTKIAQALHIARPHYPLIDGGKQVAPRAVGAPNGGLAA